MSTQGQNGPTSNSRQPALPPKPEQSLPTALRSICTPLAIPNPSPSPLTFYPPFCHLSSPTYRQWVPLSAYDIHHQLTRSIWNRSSDSATNPYFFLNHPIRFVCVVGVVVGVSEVVGRWMLDLDDSSGAGLKGVVDRPRPRAEVREQFRKIQEGLGREQQHEGEGEGLIDRVKPLATGDVVRVHGTIGMFRGMKQLMIETLVVLKEAVEEVRFWEARRRLKNKVLMKPWVLVEEEVQRLRRQEEDRIRAQREAVERLREWERERELWDERVRVKIEKTWEREEELRKDAAEVAKVQGLSVNQRPKAAGVLSSEEVKEGSSDGSSPSSACSQNSVTI